MRYAAHPDELGLGTTRRLREESVFIRLLPRLNSYPAGDERERKSQDKGEDTDTVNHGSPLLLVSFYQTKSGTTCLEGVCIRLLDAFVYGVPVVQRFLVAQVALEEL